MFLDAHHLNDLKLTLIALEESLSFRQEQDPLRNRLVADSVSYSLVRSVEALKSLMAEFARFWDLGNKVTYSLVFGMVAAELDLDFDVFEALSFLIESEYLLSQAPEYLTKREMRDWKHFYRCRYDFLDNLHTLVEIIEESGTLVEASSDEQ